jgi:hypothetical protein
VGIGSRLEDLQAVSQHVLACSEQIALLEQEKRSVDPGSERFRTLSNEIEALAEEVRSVSHAETDLAQAVSGVPGLPTIAEADQKP